MLALSGMLMLGCCAGPNDVSLRDAFAETVLAATDRQAVMVLARLLLTQWDVLEHEVTERQLENLKEAGTVVELTRGTRATIIDRMSVEGDTVVSRSLAPTSEAAEQTKSIVHISFVRLRDGPHAGARVWVLDAVLSYEMAPL